MIHSASVSTATRPYVRMPLLVAALGLPGLALATSPNSQTSPLDTVVVTATRVEEPLQRSLSEVSVVDRARIDGATGRSVPELLAREPGVQFWANGGLGKVSSVSLRGFEPRHTLLLVDGVRFGSATVGAPTWDNLPLDAIERIEVVRGPLSGLYGSDAVGGVVQIFTRGASGRGLRFDAQATSGSEDYRALAGGVRYGGERFDGALRFERRLTDGFSATNPRVPFGQFNPDDDGFRQSSGSAQFGWNLAEDWRLDARWFEARGLSRFDDGPNADSRAEYRSRVASVGLRGRPLAGWTTTLRVARAVDDFDQLASASRFVTTGVTGTEQRQVGFENAFETPVGTALLVAERIDQDVRRPGAAYAVSGRSITGVGAGLSGEAGRHGWQASLRRDRNSQFGAETTGSVGYGFDLTPTLRATASWGRSFVAPSFNQLYFPGFGNPNLLPERGRQSEVALRYAGARFGARIGWFDARIRGYISSGPAPVNIPRTRIDGITASFDARLGEWTLSAGIDDVEPRNATRGSANFDRRLPRRVERSGRLAADWQRGALAAGATLVAYGERFENAANTQRLGGFATLDLRADWRVNDTWSVGLRLNNALDRAYETVLGYDAPGREAFVTVQARSR